MNNHYRLSIPSKLCVCLGVIAFLTSAARAEAPPLGAAQVVDKNVVARGGATAWGAIRSISFVGKIDAGRTHPTPPGTVDSYSTGPSDLRPGQRRMMIAETPVKPEEVIALPFRLDLKRPRKSRLELDFAGDTATQVYDGTAGWKVRPFMGRTTVESFSPAEIKIAASQQELDGLLINAAAKGSQIRMEGMDSVNGVRAYKLRVALRDGNVRRVWVDAATFLDIKVDGARDVGGRSRAMTTLLSDYRRIDGVMIPFKMETHGDGLKDAERIVVEKVVINPDLPDTRFAKP